MPLDLSNLFTKINAFIAEARNETADAANRAADLTQQITDWLRDQAGTIRPPVQMSAGSSLECPPELEACCAKLEAFVAEPPVAKGGAESVQGLPWKGIAAFILQLLQAIGPFLPK